MLSDDYDDMIYTLLLIMTNVNVHRVCDPFHDC